MSEFWKWEILRLLSHHLWIKNTIFNRACWDDNTFTSKWYGSRTEFLKTDYIMDYLGSTFRDSDLIALELYPKPKSTGSFFFFPFPNLPGWLLCSSKGLELLEWRTGGVPLLCHHNSVFFPIYHCPVPYTTRLWQISILNQLPNDLFLPLSLCEQSLSSSSSIHILKFWNKHNFYHLNIF